MKKFALLALATAIALPASAAGVTIGGYIDLGWFDMQGGSSLNGGNTFGQASASTTGVQNAGPSFSFNEVNIDVSAQLTNDISAFASIDFNPQANASITGGGTGATIGAIDYAYIDIANPGPFDLNVRAGRIPSVIGIEQRTSESPQTRFINLSLLSRITVGSLEGAAIYGSFSPVNYAFAVSNGDNLGAGNSILSLGQSAGAPVALSGQPFGPSNNNGSAKVGGLDTNNDKAISGRLGVVPIEGLEVGVSGSLDRFPAAPAAAAISINKNAKRLTYGVDASYTFGAFGLKGEYQRVSEEQQGTIAASLSKASFTGYYVEGTWDINSKYAAGVRYNRAKMVQAPALAGAGGLTTNVISDYHTWQVAGVYHVADNVHLKAEYDLNSENVLNRISTRTTGAGSVGQNDINNDVIALSLVGAF